MFLYLSSYKFGNDPKTLKNLFQYGKKIGLIPNALDFTGADSDRRKKNIASEIVFLEDLGLEVQEFDLKNYFGKSASLRSAVETINGVWVCGGNTFVLLQAMRLSGFDKVLVELSRQSNPFVYAGYSAAGCALAPDMTCYANVDNANDFPYKTNHEVNWTGLGILNFAFMPHFQSDHRESSIIDSEIKFCIENKMLFKALRDGEALIVDLSH